MKTHGAIQFTIEGDHFDSIQRLHAIAVERGFDGSVGATAGRLRNGASTWAELVVPTLKCAVRGAATRKIANAIARAEMAAMCAELDARRAALKAAT